MHNLSVVLLIKSLSPFESVCLSPASPTHPPWYRHGSPPSPCCGQRPDQAGGRSQHSQNLPKTPWQQQQGQACAAARGGPSRHLHAALGPRGGGACAGPGFRLQRVAHLPVSHVGVLLRLRLAPHAHSQPYLGLCTHRFQHFTRTLTCPPSLCPRCQPLLHFLASTHAHPVLPLPCSAACTKRTCADQPSPLA